MIGTRGRMYFNRQAVDKRDHWPCFFEYLMSVITYLTVDTPEILLFPYLMYKNGGAAFIVACAVGIVIAFPVTIVEFSFGHMTGGGVLTSWKAFPALGGVGFSILLVQIMLIVYTVPMFSLGSTFIIDYWRIGIDGISKCDNYWNTERCKETLSMDVNDTSSYVSYSLPPSLEYFRWISGVLDTDSIEDVGGLHLLPAVLNCVLWILIFLVLSFGIKSLGKVSYVLTVLAYFAHFALFVRAVTLPGSNEGLKYLAAPAWNKLGEMNSWLDGITFVMIWMGTGQGVKIVMGSYNKNRKHYFMYSFMVTLISLILKILTTAVGACIAFGFFGYLSFMKNVPMDEVVTSGLEFPYVVVPEVLLSLPSRDVWFHVFFLYIGIMFFKMQVFLVETFVTSLTDIKPNILYGWRKMLVTLGICICMSVLSLLFCTSARYYILVLCDFIIGSMLKTIITAELFAFFLFGILQSCKPKVHARFDVKWLLVVIALGPATLISAFYLLKIMASISVPFAYQYSYPTWTVAVQIVFIAIVPISVLIGGLVACCCCVKGKCSQRFVHIWLPPDTNIANYQSQDNQQHIEMMQRDDFIKPTTAM